MTALLLVAELVALFFLSRAVVRSLFGVTYRLTKSKPVAVSFVTALLYPGTVIHELSHLFTAEILGVRTGKITLIPEAIEGTDQVQSGSVEVSKTGPFRRAVIGLSPLFSGLLAITALSYLQSNQSIFLQMLPSSSPLFVHLFICLFVYYLMFAVSATMFPSGPDMKGVLPVFGVLVIVAIAFWLLDIRISIAIPSLAPLLSLLVKNLGITALIHVFFIGIAKGIISARSLLAERKETP